MPIKASTALSLSSSLPPAAPLPSIPASEEAAAEFAPNRVREFSESLRARLPSNFQLPKTRPEFLARVPTPPSARGVPERALSKQEKVQEVRDISSIHWLKKHDAHWKQKVTDTPTVTA